MAASACEGLTFSITVRREPPIPASARVRLNTIKGVSVSSRPTSHNRRKASSSPECGVAVSSTTRRARVPSRDAAVARSDAPASACASSKTMTSQTSGSRPRITSGRLT